MALKHEDFESGYAPVNGLRMYYESYGAGAGAPLVLVHGGFGVISIFEPILAELATTRQVIGVELQGHGHTADVDRPLSYEGLADDVAALIAYLGLAHADVLGYSLGGGVAQQCAIRHPDRVRKLVVVSAPCRSDGWYPEVRAGMRSVTAEAASAWIGSPMQQAYAAVAPDPAGFPLLADKTGRLLSKDYDWSQEITRLQAPALIVAADADSVRTAHAVEFFELLGGGKADAGLDGSGIPSSRLAILSGATHYDILSAAGLGAIISSFLDHPHSRTMEIDR